MLLYTTHEAGNVTVFPIKCNHSKLLKQLYRHRNGKMKKSEYSERMDYYTHVKKTGQRLPFRVHSVFFCKNNKIVKIWDATLNGYRNMKKLKNTINHGIIKNMVNQLSKT